MRKITEGNKQHQMNTTQSGRSDTLQVIMGQHVSRTDFEWVYTEEPHASRRKVILKKYPEMKKLMGPDYNTVWVVTLMVLSQLFALYFVRDTSWPVLLLAAYCFGGVINHSLMLANHEISHNLAFGHSQPLANRLLGMFANLPLGLPMSVSFKKYHLDHHRYQGDDELDVDIPSRLEARLFSTTWSKLVWVILQPLFYAIRPLCVQPKPVTNLELLNISVQVMFDVVVVYLVGVKSLMYLILGSLLSMGLHPVAGHFISEHYMFKKGFETYSYYGPLNSICFNVGYHVEHHDFPGIPGSRLPQVKSMAPEFYDHNPCHYSWSKVIWDFITDPAIGPYARVKRPTASLQLRHPPCTESRPLQQTSEGSNGLRLSEAMLNHYGVTYGPGPGPGPAGKSDNHNHDTLANGHTQ